MSLEKVNGVYPRRTSGRIEGDFVVFLIGFRINKPWKLHKWVPVMMAMPPMLRELEANPDLGLLGHHLFVGRTSLVVQYWRSTEQLLAYAKSRDAAHLPAWRAFNKRVGTSGDVGIWHETYRVRAGDYESIYVNMPAYGLGKSGELVPATGKREDARGRLAAA
jgi:hypothetical protein